MQEELFVSVCLGFGGFCLFEFTIAISYSKISFETFEMIILDQIFHITSAKKMIDHVEKICCSAETTFSV